MGDSLLCAVAGCGWKVPAGLDDVGTPVISYRFHLREHGKRELRDALELLAAGRLMADQMIASLHPPPVPPEGDQ